MPRRLIGRTFPRAFSLVAMATFAFDAYSLAAQALPAIEPGTYIRASVGAEPIAGVFWYVEGDTLALANGSKVTELPASDITRLEIAVNLSELRRDGAKRGLWVGGGIGAAASTLAIIGFLESGWEVAAAAGVGFALGGGLGAFLGASVGPQDIKLEWVTVWERTRDDGVPSDGAAPRRGAAGTAPREIQSFEPIIRHAHREIW